jgi:predicted ATPase/DNA-binding SARP family transcriptional activator
MPILQIQLLGDLQIAYDGTQVKGVNTARLQSLLAYLLIHRQASQSRQQLAFLFWPDTVEAKARANLRFFLHRLRRALPDADRFIQIDETSVVWRADAPFTLDVAVFEDALEKAKQEMGEAAVRALESAVSLYRGDLLPTCYDDWILPERERLRQLYLAALARLIQEMESQGEYRAAISRAQQLLRYDPLHEETYRQLMRLHAKNGDHVGALRAFHTCAAVLERELAVEPSPATRAEYKQLLRQTTPATAAVKARPAPDYAILQVPNATPNNLQLSLTSFIGREREISEVKLRLATTRLLTLTGTGGSGKTRLALEGAIQLLLAGQAQLADSRYPDGIWWIELAALGDPALVTQAVAAVLEVREERRKPLSEALIGSLRQKLTLLVWDNCEHVIDACAQLAETLLRACPGVSILATSREPLRIEGETTWSVPALSLPDKELLSNTDSYSQITQFEAVRLFSERAALAFPAFTLTPGNAAAVVEICRKLDGLPLAIELAAARVKVLRVEQIADRLDDRFNLLKAAQRRSDARHQSLRAVMDWSFELLAPAERALFQRLAVFAGGFTLEAVEAACAGDGLESHQLLELLSLLVDKSLVRMDQGSGEARFDLLETIRQYASGKLVESDQVEAVRGKHANFYLMLAERVHSALRGPQQELWLERMEREHDNLRAALAWSQTPAGKPEVGLRLAGNLWRFWGRRGHLSEGRRTLEAMLARVPAHTAARAQALDGAGWLAYSQGDHLAARVLDEESLLIWREVGDRKGMALALNNLGNVAHKLADYATARQFHEESLKLRRELGDQADVAASLHNLGMVALDQGDYLSARALFEESLAFKQQLGNKWDMVTTINSLGGIALERGEADTAWALYEQSLALGQELGDKGAMAMVLINMGNVALRQGDFAAAHHCLEQGLVLRRELGHRWGAAVALHNLGMVAMAQGNPGEARGLFAESLDIRREVGDRLGIAHCLAGLAGVAWSQARPERASRVLGAIEALLEALGARLDVIERDLYNRYVAELKAHLGEDQFATAWAAGRALPLEVAIDEALTAV